MKTLLESRLSATLLFVFCAFTTHAQRNGANFDCPACLKEVHFGGSKGNNYITIYDDLTDAKILPPQYVSDCESGGGAKTNLLLMSVGVSPK